MDEHSLWQAWRDTGDVGAREALLGRHLPYAKTLAAVLFAKRSHDAIPFEDYLQWARLGLMEAFGQFDPARSVQFRTYAAHRIRGSVLSGLAHMSEQQEQINCRRRLRTQRAEVLAEAATQETPSDALVQLAQVAVGLAVSFMLEGTALYQDEAHPTTNGYDALELAHLQRRIRELVGSLPDPQRTVIQRHYQHAHPLDDIAQDLNVTRGRVSQIHGDALRALRNQLTCKRTGARLL